MRDWPPTLDPTLHHSPSGEYSLLVDPGDRYGRGGATYRLTCRDREVWSRPLPFTLWEACVSDAGMVGGYGYTHGPQGMAPGGGYGRGPGEMFVVALDAQGQPSLHERALRCLSLIVDGDPEPSVYGLLPDLEHDRFILRVHEPGSRWRDENWWIYLLSSGRLLARYSPMERLPDETGVCWITAACPVSGTPLTLVQFRLDYRADLGWPWWLPWSHPSRRPLELLGLCRESRLPDRHLKAVRFALFDLEGRVVWTRDSGRFFSRDGKENREAAADWYRELREAPESDRLGEFALRFASLNQRVRFAVTQSPDTTWNVHEVERRHYAPPAAEEPALPEIPGRPLVLLGAVLLRLDGRILGDTPDAGRLWALSIDSRERIYGLYEHTRAVYVSNTEGTLLHACRPDPPDFPDANEGMHLAVAADGEVYIGARRISKHFDEGYLRFSPAGERLGSVPKRLDSTERWYFQVQTGRLWAVTWDQIALVDATGEIIRRIARRPDRNWLRWIRAAAVAPDGSLAVLEEFYGRSDKGCAQVSLYSPEGEPLRLVSISPAIANANSVALSDELLLVAGTQGLFAYHPGGEALWTAPVPARGEHDPEWRVLLPQSARELWLYNSTGVVHRYALPGA